MSKRFQRLGPPGGPARLSLLALLVLQVAAPGCASFQAARLYHEGTASLDRGDPELAIEQLERAAELQPNASEVHNHLGLAYWAAGRERDAQLAFRRAVELDCGNSAAAANLRVAEASAARGDP